MQFVSFLLFLPSNASVTVGVTGDSNKKLSSTGLDEDMRVPPNFNLFQRIRKLFISHMKKKLGNARFKHMDCVEVKF